MPPVGATPRGGQPAKSPEEDARERLAQAVARAELEAVEEKRAAERAGIQGAKAQAEFEKSEKKRVDGILESEAKAKAAGDARQAGQLGQLGGLLGVPGAGVAGNVAGNVMSGAAAAAGPVGVALMAAAAVKELAQSAANGAAAVGSFAVGVAALDVKGVANGFADLLKTAPLVGDALSTIAKIPLGLSEAFAGTAQRLSGYNGALAEATALARVKAMQQDIKQAENLGPELAKFTSQKAELDARINDSLAEISKEFLPTALESLKQVNYVLIGTRVLIQGVKDANMMIVDALAQIPGPLGELLTEMIRSRKLDEDRLELEKKKEAGYFDTVIAQITGGGGFNRGAEGAGRGAVPVGVPARGPQALPFQF